jgi:hypothetical protein
MCAVPGGSSVQEAVDDMGAGVTLRKTRAEGVGVAYAPVSPTQVLQWEL